MNEVVILIPSYEPDEKLVKLIEKLLQIRPLQKIVVLDDGSEPEVAQLVALHSLSDRCDVVKHAVNLGKGRALKDGFNYIANKYPHVRGIVTADSDGQHQAEDIYKVADAVLKNKGQIVLGCRDFSASNIPLRSRFGNQLTYTIFRIFTGLAVKDTQTGLRGIPLDIAKKFMTVPGERFEYEMNMLMECSDKDIGIVCEPIDTIYIENNASSHFNPVVDSIKIYFVLFKYIFSSVFSAAIDILVFAIAMASGTNKSTAMVLGRVASSTTNFLINRDIVFKKDVSLIKSFVKYVLLVMISGYLAYSLMGVIEKYLMINVYFAKIVAETLLFFINFFVQKHLIFRSIAK